MADNEKKTLIKFRPMGTWNPVEYRAEWQIDSEPHGYVKIKVEVTGQDGPADVIAGRVRIAIQKALEGVVVKETPNG